MPRAQRMTCSPKWMPVDEDGTRDRGRRVVEPSPLGELFARERDEATAHRALLVPRVATPSGRVSSDRAYFRRGDADRHLLERADLERIGGRELGPGVERHLVTVAIGDARG